MVVTFYRYRIVLVVPRCQLNTRIQRDGFPQDRILLAKRFKGIVSVRHDRKRVIDWNISLRRVVSRCQPPGKKKAQDFASLPQAGESP